jgi:hypothetical protein
MSFNCFTEHINKKYFRGDLSKTQLESLESVDSKNFEAQSFIDRASARINQLELAAKDISELTFWQMSVLWPKILPGTWGGIVPPITLPNRHILIDDYIERNHWQPMRTGHAILDMGCGFPPHTSVALAERFPQAKIIGADPSFGKYTVTDPDGCYACIQEDGSIKYLQPSGGALNYWETILKNLERTKARFQEMFQILGAYLSPIEPRTTFDQFESDGYTIIRNPLRKFESNNLSFIQKGIGQKEFPFKFHFIRCMNVLVYFDPAFRSSCLTWAYDLLEEGGIFICSLNYAQTVDARLSIYQKYKGKMRLREFSFSIENIRPIESVPFFSFREDDFELVQFLRYVMFPRRNKDFMVRFNSEFDRLLVKNIVYTRNEDGYLGHIDSTKPIEDIHKGMFSASRNLSEQFGNEVVEILKRANSKAWLNEIGFISIQPKNYQADN